MRHPMGDGESVGNYVAKSARQGIAAHIVPECCTLIHRSRAAESGLCIRAVRYRVLPSTRAKARRLNRLAGACRFVWNEMLDQQDILHDTARMFGGRAPSPTFFTLGKSFTELRRSNHAPWLAELPFAVVRYALKRQADAWQRFFKGEAGRPKFKGRGCGMGFTIPDRVRIRDGRIAVPRTGEYRLRRRGGSPHQEGIPKQAVFTPEGGKGHDQVGQGHCGKPRIERQGQVRPEPRHSVERVGRFGAEPGLQGGESGSRESRPHVASLP